MNAVHLQLSKILTNHPPPELSDAYNYEDRPRIGYDVYRTLLDINIHQTKDLVKFLNTLAQSYEDGMNLDNWSIGRATVYGLEIIHRTFSKMQTFYNLFYKGYPNRDNIEKYVRQYTMFYYYHKFFQDVFYCGEHLSTDMVGRVTSLGIEAEKDSPEKVKGVSDTELDAIIMSMMTDMMKKYKEMVSEWKLILSLYAKEYDELIEKYTHAEKTYRYIIYTYILYLDRDSTKSADAHQKPRRRRRRRTKSN